MFLTKYPFRFSLALITFLLFTVDAKAQEFNFQGVARKPDGTPLVNQNINVKLTIPGTSFTETHPVTTTPFGLFKIDVGSISSLAGINWSTPRSLNVEIDSNPLGSSSLKYVPYAIFSEQLRGFSLNPTPPSLGQVLKWNGSAWAPGTDNSGSVTASLPIVASTVSGVTTLSIPQANASTDGYLSFADWNLFKGKQDALNLTTSGNSGSSTFNSSTSTLNIPTYTLSGLGGIGLANLTATNPLTYNNATGAFGITKADASTDGYLSKIDWDIFNKKLTANSPISAGTNTKITYDANGLVTSGTQATATDISNTASGTITATTVQGALNELDTKKLAGIGTANYLPRFTNPSTLGISSIFDNGNVGIGTSSPTQRLHVAGNISATNIISSGNISANTINASGSLNAPSIVSSGSINAPNIISSGSINAPSIIASGSIAANTITTSGSLVVGGDISSTGDISTDGVFIYGGNVVTSDLRLKRNIVPFNNALQTIEQLVPVSYEKKNRIDSDDYKYKEIGFIAQELRNVLPNLVREGTDKDKTLSVNYISLIPVLTKAIQEQQDLLKKQNLKIEELSKRLEKLEGLVNDRVKD